MPLYHQIILLLPKYDPVKIATFFRRHSALIISLGGNVRTIQNHGIRPLPERAIRKYATSDGVRRFWDAQFITSTFDASPKVLISVDRLLKNEESVLRFFTVKGVSAADKVNARSFKNPYFIRPPRNPTQG